jgi:hypothetical protein
LQTGKKKRVSVLKLLKDDFEEMFNNQVLYIEPTDGWHQGRLHAAVCWPEKSVDLRITEGSITEFQTIPNFGIPNPVNQIPK